MAAADSPVSNVNDSPQSAQLVDEGKASLFFLFYRQSVFFSTFRAASINQ